MNQDLDIARALRSMLEAMQQHPSGSPTARVLENFLPDSMASKADRWLLDQAKRAADPPTVVLSLECPGFVTLGLPGEEITVPDPGLLGLEMAHDVFQYGINVSAVIRSSDFGKTPGAMREALRRAASWADRHCTLLAVAIRAIKVSENGVTTFQPNHPLNVRVVFAWSDP